MVNISLIGKNWQFSNNHEWIRTSWNSPPARLLALFSLLIKFYGFWKRLFFLKWLTQIPFSQVNIFIGRISLTAIQKSIPPEEVDWGQNPDQKNYRKNSKEVWISVENYQIWKNLRQRNLVIGYEKCLNTPWEFTKSQHGLNRIINRYYSL